MTTPLMDVVQDDGPESTDATTTLELPRPPRLTLREIADESLLIDALLAAADGELTPELEQRLDALAAAIVAQPDGIDAYLSGLEADAGVLREEEKRLAENRRKLQARAERFERYVHDQMIRMDRRHLAGLYRTLDIVNNPPKLRITDRSLVPEQYITREHVPATVVETVREDEIKAALLARERAIAAHDKLVAQAAKRGQPAPALNEAALPPAVAGAELQRSTRLRRQ